MDGSTPHVYIPSEAECGTQLARDPNLRLALIRPDSIVTERGYYEKGTCVYHAEPATDKPMGWVCHTSGSPGGWFEMPSPLPV